MFQRFRNFLGSLSLSASLNSRAMHDIEMPRPFNEKGIVYKLTRMHQFRNELAFDKYKIAVQSAESTTLPNRRYLYEQYRQVDLDDQVIAQRRIAVQTVKRAPFTIVNENEKEQKIKKRLFKTTWFSNYMEAFVMTEFWGHTLIEFDPQKNEKGEFVRFELVPREHVRPEYGDILLRVSDTRGVDYRRGGELPFVIEIMKSPYDLGLYQAIAPSVIFKRYSSIDWSRRSERFGMPIVIGKTASRQKNEADAMEGWLANLGSQNYAVIDDADNIEFIETGHTDAYKIYADRIALCDNQISKMINGQTGASDEKAWSGSAQVHERILNDFTFARLQDCENHINDVLIPFLVRNGYALKGLRFQFNELQEKMPDMQGTIDQSTDDNGNQPNGKSDKVGEKKNANPSLSLFYRQAQQENCCAHNSKLSFDTTLSLNLDLGKIVEDAAKRVYAKRLVAGELDPEIWKANYDKLLQAIEQGWGKTILQTQYTDPDLEYLLQLRRNIAVFAAFKNYHNVADMVAALTDNKGKVREWADFQKIVATINNEYNQSWLRTEYQTAIGTAQMAKKWHDTINLHGSDVMLRYSTVGDARVRQSHQDLNGTTLPANSPFWATHYPPNGWGCRCDVDVVPNAKPKPPKEGAMDKDVPQIFRNNAGQSAELFLKEHPYYKDIATAQRENIYRAINKLEYSDYDPTLHIKNKEAFKNRFRKEGAQTVGWHESTNTYTVVHTKHSVAGLINELPQCAALNKLGHSVELTDESTNATYNAIIDQRLYQLKRILKESNTGRRMEENLKAVLKSGAKRVLISVETNNEDDFENAQKKCARNIRDFTRLEEIWFIHKEQSFRYHGKKEIAAWLKSKRPR